MAYKRALLKLSGEAFMGEGAFGIAEAVVRDMAQQIKAAHDTGLELGVVVGGGNYIRGATFQQQGLDRVAADQMGMLATAINGLALQNALEQEGVETRMQSAIEMRSICEPLIIRRALRHLDKGRVVIFVAGTGAPFVTTDTAAVLRAAEVGAEILFKATNVDGVFDKDPKTNPDAQAYSELDYNDIIRRQLRVMDLTAVSLAQDRDLPLRVFNLKREGNIARALRGEPLGTLVRRVEQ
jgi:uridylate kinase